MRRSARVTLIALVGYVTLGSVYLLLGPRLRESGWPSWCVVLLALTLAALIGRFVWCSPLAADGSMPTATEARGQAVKDATVTSGGSLRGAAEPRAAMRTWAMILGLIGFAGGYFGPMIFDPNSNQGPLLGVFITGPLGFAVGSCAGWWWWATYKGPSNGKGDAG